MSRMDAIDRKILAVLQTDASLSVAEIGQRVGLSSTPCWKRIQRLESEGVIQKRVAIIDPEKIGLGDYGKPGRFLERQVDRWAGQLASYKDKYAGYDGRSFQGYAETEEWLQSLRRQAARPGRGPGCRRELFSTIRPRAVTGRRGPFGRWAAGDLVVPASP